MTRDLFSHPCSTKGMLRLNRMPAMDNVRGLHAPSCVVDMISSYEAVGSRGDEEFDPAVACVR